jgi:hypothetical protein
MDEDERNIGREEFIDKVKENFWGGKYYNIEIIINEEFSGEESQEFLNFID